MPGLAVESAPRRGRASVPGRTQIIWLGHATVLIELGGVRLLTDPVLRANVGPLVRFGPDVPRDAIRDVDAVLLSHLHRDHADGPSLRRLGRDTRVIAPAGSRRRLRGLGMSNVEELEIGAWTKVGSVGVCATPARHRAWPSRAEPAGFLACGEATCYFAGDTDVFAGMSWLAGGIDVALLPVGGWGAKTGPGHLDAARAAEAACAIAPRYAVPIHWGTLAPIWPPASRPDLRRPGREFARELARRSRSVTACVLPPGGTLALDSAREDAS